MNTDSLDSGKPIAKKRGRKPKNLSLQQNVSINSPDEKKSINTENSENKDSNIVFTIQESTNDNNLIHDESTNFCNINSKGSNFNTLDSGKNLIVKKDSFIE